MESPRQLRSRHGMALAVLLLNLASVPVFAQSTQDGGSTASTAPAASSKLATRTQIVANNDELAMLTGGSEQALADAIVLYQQIVKNGGWPQITSKKLTKGAKGEQVLLLRQRLIFENYLPFETLGGPNGSLLDAEMVEAVKAFQVNHGVAPTGTVAERTLVELNIPAESASPRCSKTSRGSRHMRRTSGGAPSWSIFPPCSLRPLKMAESSRVTTSWPESSTVRHRHW